MGKNDIEKVEKEILKIIQAKFPDKITEINTEKNKDLAPEDQLVLKNVSNDKYFSDFYQKELTPSLFIFFGIEQAEMQSIGSDSAETWSIFYHVFIEDENNLSKIRSQVLRYTRALKEIINENSDKISRFCSKGEISSLTPENVEDITNDTPFKMGGIEFKITLS